MFTYRTSDRDEYTWRDMVVGFLFEASTTIAGFIAGGVFSLVIVNAITFNEASILLGAGRVSQTLFYGAVFMALSLVFSLLGWGVVESFEIGKDHNDEALTNWLAFSFYLFLGWFISSIIMESPIMLLLAAITAWLAFTVSLWSRRLFGI